MSAFKVHPVAVLLLLFLVLAPSWAKPVQETRPEDAIQHSNFIVSAEVISREYDNLREGESLQRQDPWSFWVEYRVIQSFKGLLKAGQTIRVSQKSNSCIPHDYKVLRRQNKIVTFYAENNKTVEDPMEGWDQRFRQGAKVFLFLDDSKNHYGWFISPSPWSPEFEKRIQRKSR